MFIVNLHFISVVLVLSNTSLTEKGHFTKLHEILPLKSQF